MKNSWNGPLSRVFHIRHTIHVKYKDLVLEATSHPICFYYLFFHMGTQEEQRRETVGVLLPLLCWVSAELRHLTVVQWLYCSREEGAPEGRQHCPKDYRLPSPISGGCIQSTLPQKSPGHHQGCIPPWAPPVRTDALREAFQGHESKNEQDEEQFLPQSDHGT